MRRKTEILVVEDDLDLVRNLTDGLNSKDFVVKHTGSAEGANFLLKVNNYDLVLLDLSLPGEDGIEVCRYLRRIKDETPVIIMTGRKGEDYEIDGLNMGADSYLTKPFSMEYLYAKIHAVLRRVRNQREPVPMAGPFQINPIACSFCINDELIYLTPKLFSTMEILIRRAGDVVNRDEIVKAVWGESESLIADRNINTHICKLRRILSKWGNPQCIETVPIVGYKLNADIF